MSLAPFKLSQLLDQPSVINQFLLILVRIAHFKRLASIFSSISRISLAAISNSTLHIDRSRASRVFICLDLRVSSEATLFYHQSADRKATTRSFSRLDQFPHCCISDETSKTLMWQLHTMAEFSSSLFEMQALNARMQMSRGEINTRVHYDCTSIIKRDALDVLWSDSGIDAMQSRTQLIFHPYHNKHIAEGRSPSWKAGKREITSPWVTFLPWGVSSGRK